jgi:hypothetical protein
MSAQPYPDPPMSTPINQGGKSPVFVTIQWNKWFQGLRVVVNRLSAGLDVNGSFTTVDGKTITIANGVVTRIQ